MPARLGVDTFVTLAGLWGLIAPKHFDDMPTTRPSDFPEADSWPASMRVCPGTEPAVLGITYEMAISRYVSEGLVAEWLEILV